MCSSDLINECCGSSAEPCDLESQFSTDKLQDIVGDHSRPPEMAIYVSHRMDCRLISPLALDAIQVTLEMDHSLYHCVTIAWSMSSLACPYGL